MTARCAHGVGIERRHLQGEAEVLLAPSRRSSLIVDTPVPNWRSVDVLDVLRPDGREAVIAPRAERRAGDGAPRPSARCGGRCRYCDGFLVSRIATLLGSVGSIERGRQPPVSTTDHALRRAPRARHRSARSGTTADRARADDVDADAARADPSTRPSAATPADRRRRRPSMPSRRACTRHAVGADGDRCDASPRAPGDRRAGRTLWPPMKRATKADAGRSKTSRGGAACSMRPRSSPRPGRPAPSPRPGCA